MGSLFEPFLCIVGFGEEIVETFCNFFVAHRPSGSHTSFQLAEKM